MNTSDYGAVVYDLDGTLVRLAVNWNAAAADAVDAFDAAGVDVAGADLWSLFERAPEHGLADDLEGILADHERRGAERSIRLSHADRVADWEVPVGVCSLNASSACRVALDRHDLLDHVDTVVGRDSVATHKPDPEPLLTAIDRLGADPSTALFVGDTERDERTAARAGVAFEWVDEAPAP
ncbi:phosphoglycolate phosphatase [Haloplanus vescus]|uniref:Phosphoglycolate phosphatase n=1 Tax=Haloplanus vescus TaxID=555874 RepID=A0A1H3WH29_9EURY|nr:HAD hydrolase-like protein [Haloplanus vescus]SDZ85642.1 phosphoglycolate phosphatase [Haloplanus vescus]